MLVSCALLPFRRMRLGRQTALSLLKQLPLQVHRKAPSCSRVAARFGAGYFDSLCFIALFRRMASADEMRVALKAYGPATAELIFLLSDNDVALEHQ